MKHPDGGSRFIQLGMTIEGMKRRGPSGAMGPTVYRIVVRGELSQRYMLAFEGMTLVAGEGQTAITGPVTDQAHLHGLLNRVSDLGLELLSVNAMLESASSA
jgi:hypothetical protein